MIDDLIKKINPVVNFGIAPEVPVNLCAKIYYWVKPFYFLLLVLVVGSIFFALGRLSALEERYTPVKISYPNGTYNGGTVLGVSSYNNSPISDIEQNIVSQAGEVIGSKTGKKYYFPWCGALKLIKPENQVHFASVDEASLAGYSPAVNCNGLK